MTMPTTSIPNIPPQISNAVGQFYRRCDGIAQTRIEAGKGPHFAAFVCSACGAHIRWIAKPRPPTEKQLRFLSALGYRGPKPETRRAASDQINDLLRGKGVGRG